MLAVSAAAIAFAHTVLGPDHYLPFVAMARARGWSMSRTLRITLLCGAGHLAGSVVLGLAGIALFLGLFDPARNSFLYSSGGHNAPVLLRADGTIQLLEAGGLELQRVIIHTIEDSTFRAVLKLSDRLYEIHHTFSHGRAWLQTTLHCAVSEKAKPSR